MGNYTHETVPTRFVENQGIRYAYRRFGKPGTVPLLFLEYFNSNMDRWDPTVTNGLAMDHEVILVDYAGVGASGGETPNTVVEMTTACRPREEFLCEGVLMRVEGSIEFTILEQEP